MLSSFSYSFISNIANLKIFTYFVISNNKSFISVNLKAVGPLGGKFDFFSPLGFEIQSEFDYRTSKIKFYSVRALKCYRDEKNLIHSRVTATISKFSPHIFDTNFSSKYVDLLQVPLREKSGKITLYNVCAVPWGCSVPWEVFSTMGDIMSTVADILSTVGVFSTVGDIMINVGYLEYRGGVQYHGGYHEYHGGYHDIMSTMGGYLEYHWGCSVPWGIL